MEILDYSVVDLHKVFREKKISAEEIAGVYKKQIDDQENDINAFITLNENLEDEAKILDKKLAEGESLGHLAGIPYSLKDNIMTEGIRTTCASKMLENFIPPYDANVAEIIKKENGLLLGKNNMDEFAVGGSSETSYFNPARNPLDKERVPGGSSGGSAASVASRESLFSIGTDTGGSIRQPSSFCGVVGIKPSYGMVSRYGVQSMSHSLDQVGVIARDVRDAFYVYKEIAKFDERDGQSRNINIFENENFNKSREEYIESALKKMKNVKIAKPKEFFADALDEKVREKIDVLISDLEKMGAEIVEIDFPHLNYALPAYYTIVSSELSSDLARFDGVRMGYRAKEYEDSADMIKKTRKEGFGREVKRRILLGVHCTRGGFEGSYYKKALQARALIIKDMNKIFENFDYIISPAAPTLPYKLGEKIDNQLQMYLADDYTVPANLAGLPAISVPCGNSGKLSVGCQIMAGRFKDLSLFDIGMAIEGGRNV